MYLASRLLVGLVVFLPTQAPTQNPAGVLVPVGARVKVETAWPVVTAEGTILAWRADTMVLAKKDGGDTVRIGSGRINKLRVIESPPLWRYTAAGDINYYAFPNLPRRRDAPLTDDPYRIELLVASQTALVGIDPGTGTPLWTREDLPDVKGIEIDIVGATGYAVITRGDTMTILDLGTGETRWDTRKLSLLTTRGWLYFPEQDSTILMLGGTAAGPATVMAVDVATGKLRWRQDSLFTVEPKVFGSGGVFYLFGNQPPFADTDTSLVLYISSEGPLRLHAKTGAVLWRGTALRGAKVPTLSDGWASILQRRGTLFVPSGDSLVALRASDGQPVWTPPRRLKSRVLRMESTKSGLLLRGEKWLDLVDPASGRSVWKQAVQLKNATRIVLRGDTTFVVSDNKVLAIGNSDGTARTLATVQFDEGEIPYGFGVWKEGFILYSWHNLTLVDRLGVAKYHKLYLSPKESFGEGLRSGMGGTTMRPTTRWAGGNIFFFTGATDPRGREGFSIVKVEPGDGHEAARIWFDKRAPSYTLQAVSSRAYYQRDARTIEAMPFPDWTALAHAARYGQTTVVEKLLAMGVDASLADEGWTALHFAARAGRGDVARVLLRRGAAVNATTDDGWTPWMLAVRQGHDSVARALREAGAQASDAATGMLNGWHLASQGKITEALAAMTQAAAQDSTLPLWPAAWQAICWNGALAGAGQAATVLPSCDKAVDRTPPGSPRYERVHLSRGIARALTGDLAGAATDLEACVVCLSSDDEDGSDVRKWLDELRDNRNPFTPAVLELLRGAP
jgi:outer membrane protein assembly factor BamB